MPGSDPRRPHVPIWPALQQVPFCAPQRPVPLPRLPCGAPSPRVAACSGISSGHLFQRPPSCPHGAPWAHGDMLTPGMSPAVLELTQTPASWSPVASPGPRRHLGHARHLCGAGMQPPGAPSWCPQGWPGISAPPHPVSPALPVSGVGRLHRPAGAEAPCGGPHSDRGAPADPEGGGHVEIPEASLLRPSLSKGGLGSAGSPSHTGNRCSLDSRPPLGLPGPGSLFRSKRGR